jgi:Transposase, Mutator family
MSVLTDLRNRGVKDVFFVVCDGLKGLPEVVSNVWPQTIVQTCIIHLIRNTFRLTSRTYWDEIKRDVKPIYTAVNAAAARSAFDELADKWGQRYPAVIRLWDNAWSEFIPFLDYDVEIRRVICSTNSIESLNARYRRAIKARGHFPSEQAAMKCLYLVTRSLDPTGGVWESPGVRAAGVAGRRGGVAVTSTRVGRAAIAADRGCVVGATRRARRAVVTSDGGGAVVAFRGRRAVGAVGRRPGLDAVRCGTAIGAPGHRGLAGSFCGRAAVLHPQLTIRRHGPCSVPVGSSAPPALHSTGWPAAWAAVNTSIAISSTASVTRKSVKCAHYGNEQRPASFRCNKGEMQRKHYHENQTDVHRTAVGGGCGCASDRRCTDGCCCVNWADLLGKHLPVARQCSDQQRAASY